MTFVSFFQTHNYFYRFVHCRLSKALLVSYRVTWGGWGGKGILSRWLIRKVLLSVYLSGSGLSTCTWKTGRTKWKTLPVKQKQRRGAAFRRALPLLLCSSSPRHLPSLFIYQPPPMHCAQAKIPTACSFSWIRSFGKHGCFQRWWNTSSQGTVKRYDF